METNIPYFSLPFIDTEASDLELNKNKSQDVYDELHPILPSHGSLLGPDDDLAQFLYGDEPLEEPDLNGPTTLHCEICRKQFDNAKKYYGHLRVHCKENKWICDKCPNEKFSTKQLLMKHILTHKPLHRVWRCPQCTMSFEALWRLQQHLFAKHLYYKPHKCPECEKSFHKKSDLEKHENIHKGVRSHLCTFCKMAFTDKSNLRRHMLTHTNEKPFCCPHCKSRFKQIASLNRHKRNCNSRHRQPEPSETVDKTVRKNYCRVCGMVFQYKSALLEHCVRAHTNNPTSVPEKENEKDDKSNNVNIDANRTVDNIVDDILSAEDDYMTMSTPTDMLNTYNHQYDTNNDNLQYELLKDMNQLYMLDDELLLNDIDFDSLQTNHIFTSDIECPVEKNPEMLDLDCGQSIDQDIMNSLYQVKSEHLPELLTTPEVPVVEKPNEYFESPTISVNECATIFESDVDLEASTSLAANLNQLIGENTVQYICTEDDDTFIISLNREIDAERLTDMLNIEVGMVDTKAPMDRDEKEELHTKDKVEEVTVIPGNEVGKPEEKEKKVRIKKCLLLVCPICDKLFTKKYNYQSHVGTHDPALRRHRCDVCGKRFSYRTTLNKHSRTHHTPTVYPEHACQVCDNTYKAAWLLKNHMERVHEGLKPYKCDHQDCGKLFYKKNDLDKHERSHSGSRPYACDACKARFSQSSHLTRHERTCAQRTHLNNNNKRPVPDLHPRIVK